jgi:hypothetical protein
MSSVLAEESLDRVEHRFDLTAPGGSYLALSDSDPVLLSFSHASGEHKFFRDGAGRLVHIAAHQFQAARDAGDVLDVHLSSPPVMLSDDCGTEWIAYLLNCDDQSWHFMLEASGEVVSFSDDEYEALIDVDRIVPLADLDACCCSGPGDAA